ncbi:MAG: amino acid adenylation domain-containing protein, partial [Bacteroidales bacterium]|nr:amino acid adenylation domain-containing protein [Bacteroidales bacterium]
GLTPANHFLAAFLQVLGRVTREDGVLITTIHNGRDDARMQESYGMLVKTLPVSMTGNGDNATFTETALAIQRQVAESADRSIYPFTHIVSRHGIRPNILYAYQGLQDYVSNDDSELLAAANSKPLELDTAKMPLSVEVRPTSAGFELVAEYDTDLYSRSDMDTLLLMIGQTALNAATSEGALAKSISMLSEADKEKIILLGQGEKYAYDTTKTWVNLFVAAAKENAGSVAVADKENRLTYAQLDTMSDALAQILIDKGVKPDDFVAIMLDRTVRFPIAALAVHKAGAAYVPLDKEYPQERIAYMLSDSGASMVIDEEFMNTLDLAEKTDAKPINLTSPYNRAYMIYTSGSTGQPKGVVIPHRALASFVQCIARRWRLTSKSHISCHSSFSFDASMEDLYPVLTVGGEMHIIPEEYRKDFDALYRFICERGITGGCYTTLFGQMLLQDYQLPVDYLVVGGEKMTANPDCGIRLINTYGPTEFTVDATFFETEPGKSYENIPIGRPLDNQTAFVVDKTMNLVPQGVAGELCLYGPQMSLGYWNRPEKTKEVFVPCPFVGKDGAKMYRTGDLVKWNDDGQLEYLGRIDNQVKLRGFRIELGEIESQAMDIEGIGQAVADVKRLNDSDYLVLYYTLAEGATLTEADIKSILDSSSLAEYMRPDFYMQLAAIPLTPNDKVNHKALPDPDLASARKEGAQPANELEAKLCKIFAETLKLETVFADDNFFKIGGTSLLGIRVLLNAKQNGIEILYKDLFDNPTPQRLAAFISTRAAGDNSDELAHKEVEKDSKNGMIDLEDYNYYRINKLLKKNTLDSFVNGEQLPLKDVVLFGANGYLGIHILEQLLEDYSGNVYCMIRAKDDNDALQRLSSLYFYYHFKSLQDYAERIHIVAGSITDKPSFDRLDAKIVEMGISHDSSVTVINCAANVKHFSAGTDIEDVNYYGCLNVLDFCKAHNYRFVQTSTMSVSGLVDMKEHVVVPDYTEQQLFVGQDYSASKYIYSKLLSERATLEAGADGLTVKVMRLGNLSPRSSDGEFQISPRTNSFMRQFKGYAAAGAYPWDVCLTDDHCAPIDDTARTVLLLAQTPKECVVFHNFNNHNILIGDVIKAMCDCGIQLRGMELEEFTQFVRTLDETTVDLVMTNVVAYKTGASTMVTPNIRNSYTHQVLLRMGFTWSDTGDLYMKKFVEGLKGLGFFDTDL